MNKKIMPKSAERSGKIAEQYLQLETGNRSMRYGPPIGGEGGLEKPATHGGFSHKQNKIRCSTFVLPNFYYFESRKTKNPCKPCRERISYWQGMQELNPH
nr:hypothetical protein [Desulfitobacterium hafniense]